MVEEKGVIKVSGSVATTCFEASLFLGSDPIIFVGLDLAYTDGLTHTKGSSFMHMGPNNLSKFQTMEMQIKDRMQTTDIQWVEGIKGEKVPTSSQMLAWKNWLEYQIAKTQIKCIDATEGGAKICGTEIIPLEEAIRIYCRESLNVKDDLKNIKENFKAKDLRHLTASFKDMLERSKLQRDLCKEGREAVSSLLEAEKEGAGYSPEAMDKMKLTYQKIAQDTIFMNLVRWEVEPLMVRLRQIKYDGLKGVIWRHKMFFEEVQRMAEGMIEGIEESLNILKLN
jgi:hypothetical protein